MQRGIANTESLRQQPARCAEGMEEWQGREMKSGGVLMRENGDHD